MYTTEHHESVKVDTISSAAFSSKGWQTVCNGCEIVLVGNSSNLLRRLPALMRACRLPRKQTTVVATTRRESKTVSCISIDGHDSYDQRAWTRVQEVQLGCRTVYAFNYDGRSYAWVRRDGSISPASGKAIDYWTLVQLERLPTTSDDTFLEQHASTPLALYAQSKVRPFCGRRSIQFFERLAPDLVIASTAIAVRLATDYQRERATQMYSNIYRHMAALGL